MDQSPAKEHERDPEISNLGMSPFCDEPKMVSDGTVKAAKMDRDDLSGE